MLSFKKASSKELRSLSDKDVMKFLEVCSKLREQFIEEYYRREELRIRRAMKNDDFHLFPLKEHVKRKRT